MKNSMMKVEQMEGSEKSFGLIPLTKECLYLEARFSMEHKVLTFMTSHPMKELKMLPKLDTEGNAKVSKVNKEHIAFERLVVDSFYSFSVTNQKDIQEIVNILCGPTDLIEYFAEKIPTLAKVD